MSGMMIKDMVLLRARGILKRYWPEHHLSVRTGSKDLLPL